MTEHQRNSLARDLVLRLGRASADEVRVIDRVLARLEHRRVVAGPLVLAERRNWLAELGSGLLDALIYCAMETLRSEDEQARTEWIGRPTVVSDEPARIALEDIRDDSSPYERIDARFDDSDSEAG